MWHQQCFLGKQEVDQASQDSCCFVDPRVGPLAEKIRQKVSVPGMLGLLLKFLNDTDQQHCLPLARIASDPEQPALFVVAPSLKIRVIKDPPVCVFQEATLSSFDTRLVVAGIGRAQVG